MSDAPQQTPEKRISWPATILIGLLGAAALGPARPVPEPKLPDLPARTSPQRPPTPPDNRTLEGECPNAVLGETHIIDSPLTHPPLQKTFSIMGRITPDETGAGYDAAMASQYLLAHAADKNKNDILITINSSGGDVNTGHALIDAIHHYGADKVSLVCAGAAISEGSILLSTGAKGKRYANLHCDFAMHSARTPIDNPDLKINPLDGLVSDEYLAVSRAQAQLATKEAQKLYMEASGGLIDAKCVSYLTRDVLTYVPTETMLRLGLVDYILIADGKAMALKPPSLSSP